MSESYEEEIAMFPFDFEEFLWANGVSDQVFDMLYLLLQVFGYTAGMLVCFIAGYYFGSVARKYVNK